MTRAALSVSGGAHGCLLGSDVVPGSGESVGFGARVPRFQAGVPPQPGVVSSGCNLLRKQGDGYGQAVLKPTHTPWAVSNVDVTAVLHPSLHFGRSHPFSHSPDCSIYTRGPRTHPVPRLPRPTTVCSLSGQELLRQPLTPHPPPLGPGPQAGFSQVAATHHHPHNESYSLLPLFRPGAGNSTPWH